MCEIKVSHMIGSGGTVGGYSCLCRRTKAILGATDTDVLRKCLYPRRAFVASSGRGNPPAREVSSPNNTGGDRVPSSVDAPVSHKART